MTDATAARRPGGRADRPAGARRRCSADRASRPTKGPAPTTPGSVARPRSQRPRAVQPRRSSARLADLRLLVNDGPGPDERYIAAGVPWFTTLFGRDSLITALQALAFRPQLAVETLRGPGGLPGDRATTRPGRRAGQDPPRAAHRRDGPRRRAAAHAVLRHGRRDAAVARSCSARRSTGPATGALVDRLWPNALARARVDRPLRRPRRRRVRRVRAPLRSRAAQPGLEGLAATRSATGTARRPQPPIALAEVQGYVYDAKRRMAAPRARPRRGGARRPGSTPRPTQLRDAVRGGVLGRGPAASTRWRSTATSGRPTRSARTPATACGAGSCRRSGRGDVVERLLRPGDVLGLGHPDVCRRGSPATTRSATTPARSGRTTRRSIAAGFKRYGFHDEANRLVGRDLRGGPALRGLPTARAVLRLRPRRRADARAVPGRLLAAGLGRRLVVPVPRDDARAARRTPTGGELELDPPAAARLAGQGHAHRTCGSATPRSTCCSTAGAARRAPRSCARSATSPSRSGSDRARRSTVDPSARRRRAPTRLRAAGSDTPRLDAELLLGHALGVDRTAVIAHPEAPGRARARAAAFEARARAARGRRARRVHPRLQGVPRARLRRRRARAHPAARDRAARRHALERGCIAA